MKFDYIVNNYRVLHSLGMKIIKHKSYIKYAPQQTLENAKQEERIQKFERMVKNNHHDWKKHKKSINEYWTGY